ncbi:hypothetical protein [Halovulum sp. GXIMD14793]
MKTLFAHAAVLCVVASGLNAQTVDETLVTLKEAFDWQGESSSNLDGLTSITLVPNGCTFTFDAMGEIDGVLLKGQMTVPFKDIDLQTLEYAEPSNGLIFRFKTKEDRKTILTVAQASGSGPLLDQIRASAKDEPENISCDEEKCELNKTTYYTSSTSLGVISDDRQLVVIEAIKTLEGLCQE